MTLDTLLKEYSGLLSRMKARDSNEKLNNICNENFKKELKKMYKDYLFEIVAGDGEGEWIFCEAVSKEDAINILVYNYGFFEEELKYLDEYSVEEAEMMGYDTY